MERNPYQPPERATGLPYAHDREGSVATVIIVDALRRTRGWMVFIGVLLAVGCGFMMLGGIAIIAGADSPVLAQLGEGRGAVMAVGVSYLLMAIFYLMPTVLIFRAASRIREFLVTESIEALERALAAQHRFWRLVGIIAIVFLGLFVGILGLGVVAEMMAALQR